MAAHPEPQAPDVARAQNAHHGGLVMRAAFPACAGIALATAAVAFGTLSDPSVADGRKDPQVPQFRVDATWPKPLPNDPATGKPWVTGEVAGTCVDARDHVFIVTRGNLVNNEVQKAVAAPPVIEFDQEGNVVNAWGDRNVLPHGIHGCFVDYQDNLWIAGNGDGVVQKWKHDGSALLLQIGTHDVCDSPGDPTANPPVPPGTCGSFGQTGDSHTLLNQPADMFVDPDRDPVTGQRGSVYIADGYGNHRVVVFDAQGHYLRQWGGVAGQVVNPLTDFPGKFASGGGGHPHCAVIGNDNLVYVCDRADDRIEVFTKTGELKRIIAVVPGTGETTTNPQHIIGSAWDFDFSKDAFQTFMFEADGGNEQMHVMDRTAGAILASFGQPGHQAGQFTYLHTIARDSKGNLFTGETINGRRVQKLVPVDSTCNNGNGRGHGYGRCDD
jgi:hypothetical protein